MNINESTHEKGLSVAVSLISEKQQWCHRGPPHFLSICRSSVSKMITVETSWAPSHQQSPGCPPMENWRRPCSDSSCCPSLITSARSPDPWGRGPFHQAPGFWEIKLTWAQEKESLSSYGFFDLVWSISYPQHANWLTSDTHQTKVQQISWLAVTALVGLMKIKEY